MILVSHLYRRFCSEIQESRCILLLSCFYEALHKKLRNDNKNNLIFSNIGSYAKLEID